MKRTDDKVISPRGIKREKDICGRGSLIGRSVSTVYKTNGILNFDF